MRSCQAASPDHRFGVISVAGHLASRVDGIIALPTSCTAQSGQGQRQWPLGKARWTWPRMLVKPRVMT